MKFTQNDISQIAQADDLHVAPLREDGTTYGTLTWIWSVVVSDELYVRAYHGQDSRWYQAAMQQKRGRVQVAGLTKEVSFEPVEGGINDQIDEAYRVKYNSSPYLDSMISPRARLASVKIVPQPD